MNDKWVVVVDGGGSKTAVSLGGDEGEFKGFGGSGNIFTLTVDEVLMSITQAMEDAMDQRNQRYDDKLTGDDIGVIYVGLAGMLSVSVAKVTAMHGLLVSKFPSATVKLMSDCYLLPLSASRPSQYYITLIAGTGSSSLCFESNGPYDVELLARSGGWGPQFGDNGSGYAMGRELIIATLKALDEFHIGQSFHQPGALKSIYRRVFQYLTHKDHPNVNDLLQALHNFNDASNLGSSRKTIASLTTILFDALQANDGSEIIADEILVHQCQSLVDLITPFTTMIDLSRTTLLLCGSLFSLPHYKQLFFNCLHQHSIQVAVELILDPSSTMLHKLVHRDP